MEFLSGMIFGSVVTVGAAFVFKFYNKSERKDDLLAAELKKDFEERITLKDRK